MLKKFTTWPNLYLFIAFGILFLAKNICFFCDVYYSAGTWGINHTVNWMWKQIEMESMPALAAACLCGAALFAIQDLKKQALYFVAVFLLIFPFHLLVPTAMDYDGFFLPLRKNRADRMLSGIKEYGHLVLMGCLLAVMGIAQIWHKPATVFYQILLGCTLLLIICSLLPGQHDHPVVLYRSAVVFGFMTAWMFAALTYLDFSGRTWLRHVLFYLSVVAGLAGSYGLWLQIPDPYTQRIVFPFALVLVSSLILIFLYHRYPHSILALIAPFIPLLCFAVILLDYQIFSFPAFSSFSIVRHLFNASTGWTALACITPALIAPFFRQRGMEML